MSMSINSSGASVFVNGDPINTSPPRIRISNLEEPGRDCIEQCLNGGGWRVSSQAFPSNDGGYYASKYWYPRLERVESGGYEFVGCECPALNTSYTPNVQVLLSGNPGQRYRVFAHRTSFDPEGGEIIDQGYSDDPGYREGFIGATGEESHEFTFLLNHSETDGTDPAPYFRVFAELGDTLPLSEATILPGQELFAECFANCSRTLGQISVPVLRGCRVDLRDSVVDFARRSSAFHVATRFGETLQVTLRNIDSPSIQDVAVVRLNQPNTVTTVELLPLPLGGVSQVVRYDDNFSLYIVEHFDRSGVRLAQPSVTLGSAWRSIVTPNVAPSEYYFYETILVIMKNKSPGAATDYQDAGFGSSCGLEGDWFLSKVGDRSYSELDIKTSLV